MNFCPNCGVPIEENSKFCKNCGAKLNADVLDNNPNPSSNINEYKKTVKTMNFASLCLLLPYIIMSWAISFFADFYTLSDRIGYILGLVWPVFFLIALFFMVRHMDKCDFAKKTVAVLHLVVSITLAGALVLGGIIMVLISYGLVIFPFIASILQALIAFKIKRASV